MEEFDRDEPHADDPLVGQVLLGKLEVRRLLGAGGMGAVYEVVHQLTRHHRALKILHAEFAEDHDVIERFLREASVAGTLGSRHVVETYDAGQLEDGSPYVLMEMLEGCDLGALLERGKLAPGRLVHLVREAAEGLGAAHDAGIVHRDVKPDNLFLAKDRSGDEHVRILDFGISKFGRPEDGANVRLTQTGRVLGTPLYMSPEQASGASDLDARTDVYSLGVILYEGLAGRPPFIGDTLPALIIRIHMGDCPPLDELAPDAPPGLRAVVERAMAREREERFEDGHALAAALAPFAEVGTSATETPDVSAEQRIDDDASRDSLAETALARTGERGERDPAFAETAANSTRQRVVLPARPSRESLADTKLAALAAPASTEPAPTQPMIEAPSGPPPSASPRWLVALSIAGGLITVLGGTLWLAQRPNDTSATAPTDSDTPAATSHAESVRPAALEYAPRPTGGASAPTEIDDAGDETDTAMTAEAEPTAEPATPAPAPPRTRAPRPAREAPLVPRATPPERETAPARDRDDVRPSIDRTNPFD